MVKKSIAEEFDQCIKCGLCKATCPVGKELLLEKYTPRGKIQLARYYHRGELELSPQYQDIYARCLLCGACVTTCPSGVNLNEVFLGMRGELAKKRGLHRNLEELVNSLATNRNISRENNAARADWRESLERLPGHRYQKEKAHVVYFVGCVASFFPMAKRIPQNVVRILEAADVDFAILAGDEWCCGFPLVGAGLPDQARQMMEHNLAKVKELGARKVVFSCPSCQRTWKESNPQGIELLHSSQMIDRLIIERKIKMGTVGLEVTYHDPCDLGRNGGIFDEPRRILKSIPGLTLVELENRRSQSVCCGGGGNLEAADPTLSGNVAKRKIEEIKRTGCRTVVTSCQQCVRTIQTAARRQKAGLKVLDITELVLTAISNR